MVLPFAQVFLKSTVFWRLQGTPPLSLHISPSSWLHPLLRHSQRICLASFCHLYSPRTSVLWTPCLPEFYRMKLKTQGKWLYLDVGSWEASNTFMNGIDTFIKEAQGKLTVLPCDNMVRNLTSWAWENVLNTLALHCSRYPRSRDPSEYVVVLSHYPVYCIGLYQSY